MGAPAGTWLSLRTMSLPPDALVVRLLNRHAPDNHYMGANARCFRSLRQVTLFARRPVILPSADFHHRHVLMLGIAGVAVVVSGERRHVLRPGHALLVPPFTLHRYEPFDGERHPIAFIGFEADIGDDSPEGVSFSPLDIGTTPISADAWQIVDSMESALRVAPERVPALTLLLLETLTAEVQRDTPSAVRHPDWERTQMVARLARMHPTIDVPDLARACGSSESVLRRAVSSTTGMPIASFVRQLRLQNSLPFAVRRRFSFAAENAGYSTVEAYSKAFKAEFGVSPSQFAELVQKNRWRVLPLPVPEE